MEKLTEVQQKWAKIYATHNLTAAYIEALEQELQETKERADSLEKKLIDAVNERETLREHLRQAYVGMEALNGELRFKS